MNAKSIIIGLLMLALLLTTYFGFFNTSEVSETDTHAEGTTEAHAHEEEKTVSLSPLQMKNIQLTYGKFEMKNLSEVIHANGYTKLPPQNQADVTLYSNAKVTAIKVIEGQNVKKGQLLAYVKSPELTKLKEEYLIVKSELAFLEEEYKRQKNLRENEVNATKSFQKTESDLNAKKARYQSLETQLTTHNIALNDEPAASVPVYAPISGSITEVYIKIGSAVTPNTTLFSLVDNQEMHVDLLVYEKDLNRIEVGQKVRFTLTNQSNTEIEGSIFNIGKSFESETKTVAVHAHISNEKRDLIPGMYVNALIDIGANKVKALPQEAIIRAEGRTYIFVKDNHDHHDHGTEDEGHHTTFRRVEVSTGPEQLGYVQVNPLEKLKKTDKIVVKGAYYLQSHLEKSEGGGHQH